MSRIYGEACEQEGDLQAGFIYSPVGTVWISDVRRECSGTVALKSL